MTGICPSCKAELDYLQAESTCVLSQVFDLDYGFSGNDHTAGEETEFFCPECSEEFFLFNEKKAIEFLKGETK